MSSSPALMAIMDYQEANGFVYLLEYFCNLFRIVVFQVSNTGPCNQSAYTYSHYEYAKETYDKFVSTAQQVELEKQQISPLPFEIGKAKITEDLQSIIYNFTPEYSPLFHILPQDQELPQITIKGSIALGDSVPIPSQFCPICEATMVKRSGKFGEFWACSNWKKTGCVATTNAEGKLSKKTIQYLKAKGKRIPPKWIPPEKPTELDMKIRSIDID